MKSISRALLLAFILGLLAYAEETQEQQVDRLIRELQNSDSDIRSIAAVTLGWIGSEDEVPALIQALQNGDKDVRVNAVVTLGQIESEDVVPVLIEASQDEDEWVRYHAAMALGEIGEGARNAVPALIRLLQDEDEWVRANAAWALGEIGKGAVPALLHALQDQDKHVRRYAVGALGKIGKGAVPALVRTLKNGNINVPLFATWSLGVLRLMIVIGFIGISGALIITIWFVFFMWKHIVLRMEMGLDKGYHSAVKEDYSKYLGQTGVALTALRPAGTTMIDGKRLDVVSVDDFIEVDMLIQVVGVNGAKITVEKSRQQTN